ncbi:response regulator transcription factor [Nocardioides lianchengensis]|uniref:DNA-binding response regulator, NarL/FixJ family, contains REC and HTH domains n=1 Tax=Nocardioides lianchengensis TaxID=1045774 RepID=A0A1G6VQT0_9ACTN|nr:response regulator transcription factor [Nocardioides lianchengensis]NYG11266.1 DNA-binding NarL/FixJ family response regulator [Nocardioides lianchengensis]SDD56020.1 DNA-binding response regulator, NarL/FixJ family, contains REC and HTH domains [Nocardioides lianchengensis]
MNRAGPNGSRTVLIEDHALFAESLEIAMSIEGYDVRRLPVPTSASGSAQLLGSIARLRPRIVLLDLDLGSFGDGASLINPIARMGANVVVVTASLERARWGECIRYGARKTLSKAQPLQEILAVVRRINHGLPVMDVQEREELLALWHHERQERQERRRRIEELTAREREVLGHLMAGRPVRDIARLSVVSEATVRTQVKSILAKLQVSSQLAAVGMAFSLEWQPPTDLRASAGRPTS